MERFVIQFATDEQLDDGLIIQPAINVEYFEAESFEQAVLQVADRLRAFEFGDKTIIGLGKCIQGYEGAA